MKLILSLAVMAAMFEPMTAMAAPGAGVTMEPAGGASAGVVFGDDGDLARRSGHCPKGGVFSPSARCRGV